MRKELTKEGEESMLNNTEEVQEEQANEPQKEEITGEQVLANHEHRLQMLESVIFRLRGAL